MASRKEKQTPKFSEGDLVRIKSREEIANSIKPTDSPNGCMFMDQMLNYCGQTFRVLRVVKNIFNERKKRTFKTQLPIYILDNITCNGMVSQFPVKCDHSCYLLWQENWLYKV